MDEAPTRIFGPNVAPSSASDAMGGYSRDDELTFYLDEDDGYNWDFADLPVDPQVVVRVSLRRDFKAIRYLCRLANLAIPENASGVFSLSLQNLNAILKRDSAVAANADAFKRVCVVEKSGD